LRNRNNDQDGGKHQNFHCDSFLEIRKSVSVARLPIARPAAILMQRGPQFNRLASVGSQADDGQLQQRVRRFV